MENTQREREREKNESKGNKGRNTPYSRAKQLVLSPVKFCLTSCFHSLSLFPSLSLSSLATSCRVMSRASFCVCLVTVFGFVFPPIHTHTHTSAYKYVCMYVWMCAAALLLCLPFCWLPLLLPMLCFFLPLIATPQSRLQIFSSPKRDRVSPGA